jgi:CNT family concentrative nucleoside transporter
MPLYLQWHFFMDILRGLFGIAVLVGIAFLFSANRKKIDWRLVGIGVFLQIAFGFLVTNVPWVRDFFFILSKGFVKLLSFSADGAEFLFGDLARNSDADPDLRHGLGFVFAFQVLPTVIFFSTVSAALYYLGVLQKVVFGIAWLMAKTMRLSGPESLSAAGNIFLGQTEAPLLVRPFVAKMTRSEIMCLMTGGMATIAGGVLAAYVSFLGGSDPQEQAQFASFLLSASIMNAPAGIVISKILIPEMNKEKVQKDLSVNKDKIGVNFIDAIANGATQGVKLAVNIGAMLLAFIALIYLVNYLTRDLIGNWISVNKIIQNDTAELFDGLTLQYMLGQIFRPLAWVMGVPWSDTLAVGSLLGQKTVINEFVAYLDLAQLKSEGFLSNKAVVVSTFALCGFSNFSSIAIQIGGIGAMAPNQQPVLSQLGLRALLAATIACMMTGTVAGAFIIN